MQRERENKFGDLYTQQVFDTTTS